MLQRSTGYLRERLIAIAVQQDSAQGIALLCFWTRLMSVGRYLHPWIQTSYFSRLSYKPSAAIFPVTSSSLLFSVSALSCSKFRIFFSRLSMPALLKSAFGDND